MYRCFIIRIIINIKWDCVWTKTESFEQWGIGTRCFFVYFLNKTLDKCMGIYYIMIITL